MKGMKGENTQNYSLALKKTLVTSFNTTQATGISGKTKTY